MASPPSLVASPQFVVADPAFAEVVGDDPRLRKLVDVDAHEGPVYVAEDDALYFTAVPRRLDAPIPGTPEVAIKRITLGGRPFPLATDDVVTVTPTSNVANGMALASDGRLVVCEQGSRLAPARVSLVDRKSGEAETLVDAWGGLPLNSPNDVVVQSDGAVWFTDPSYGHLQGFRPEPQVGDFVYRHDPATGRTTVVTDDFVKPNGIAFSPDERTLYVTDSGANLEPGSYHVAGPHRIVAYDVIGGRRLAGRRLFAVVTPGFPDGLKTDEEGRVYASSFAGVQVFDPEGEHLGTIPVPGAVNFAFGGPDRNLLLITADTAIWAVALRARGLGPPTRGSDRT